MDGKARFIGPINQVTQTTAVLGSHGGGRLYRVITLWPLVFYGLGVIVGAGIYVAIGEVIDRAGQAAPLSFLLAGAAALLTGLSYAELAGRFPEASGGAAYVRRSFDSRPFGAVVGIITAVAVAISAASIAAGAVTYLVRWVALPEPLLVAAVIVGLTVVAAAGVRVSVGLAALIGLIEIGGLVAAVMAGFAAAPIRAIDIAWILPAGVEGFTGAIAGAFIAFFAFMGFETMANLGEEVQHPQRTLPRAIIIAVGASLVLYVAVAAAAVAAGGPSQVSLISLFEGNAAGAFAIVGAVAISNGVMVEIIMLARLFYGLATHRQLPAPLGRVSPRTQTPVLATLTAGTIVLVAALALPFHQLLVLANTLTLAVFALVDLALWRLHRTTPPLGEHFKAPAWVPPAGAAASLLLILAEFVR
jgi:amino acid transporter